MVLVYLMGIADIFAAVMLVTGLRAELILYFTIAMLAVKGITSFYGRFNPIMYVLGAADLLAIVMLWQGSLWQIGNVVVFVMVVKGLISFWEINLFRNTAVNAIYVVYRIFRVTTKQAIENKLWFGKSVPKSKVYDHSYFYNTRKNNF